MGRREHMQMDWKVVFIPLTGFAYSNYHSPSGYEEKALNELAALIEQGYSIQMSHTLETATESNQRYVWVYLVRAAQS